MENLPSKSLEFNIRQTHISLNHLRDVVDKKTFDMLAGNGTIVLESVTSILMVLKQHVLVQQNSQLAIATKRVHLNLASLMRLCDEYVLLGKTNLKKEDVSPVIHALEEAIDNIVFLIYGTKYPKDVCDKLSREEEQRALPEKTTLGSELVTSTTLIPTSRKHEGEGEQFASSLEKSFQPRESIFEAPPPPKPPHPDRMHLEPSTPPPLPPKMKQKTADDTADSLVRLESLSLQSGSQGELSSVLSLSPSSLCSGLEGSSNEEIDVEDEDDIEDETYRSHKLDKEESIAPLLGYSIENQSRTLLSMKISESSSLHTFQRKHPSTSPKQGIGASIPGLLECSTFPSETTPLEQSSAALEQFSVCQTESGFSSMLSRSSAQSYSASSQQLSSSRSSQQSYTSHESHHTEKKISTMESKFHHKFKSFAADESHFSQQEQTVSTMLMETRIEGSPSHKQEGHEIMIHECPLHASRVSSTTETHKYSLLVNPDEKPPALPEKRKKRHLSHHENIEEVTSTVESSSERSSFTSLSVTQEEVLSQRHSSLSIGITEMSQKHQTDSPVLRPELTQDPAQNLSLCQPSSSQSPKKSRPPLPPKKKHIMAYMEMFGNSTHTNPNEFFRHSIHTYNRIQAEWLKHQKLINPAESYSLALTFDSTPSTLVEEHESESKSGVCGPPALPPKKRSMSTAGSSSPTPTLPQTDVTERSQLSEQLKEALPRTEEEASETRPTPTEGTRSGGPSKEGEEESEVSLMDLLDVSDFLVMKEDNEDGPNIRGGHPDALIIHAAMVQKFDYLFQEALLTTYRTFISPFKIIEKLCFRHNYFINNPGAAEQKAAREAFSLLVRVVDGLTIVDLDEDLVQTLVTFIYQLLCRGDLTMAKALRILFVNKVEAKKLHLKLASQPRIHCVSTRRGDLFDFKSHEIAQQMTLIDGEFFSKLHVSEALVWVHKQIEEKSPNLTKFTEHFNKMSYWARTRILEQQDLKKIQKYVVKFLKIMKELRKINNYNSYLSLLSALDSAPVRRLIANKNVLEVLNRYCLLIESNFGFRRYRTALAETTPPCIPYIGIVLQDLTFINYGNDNFLLGGVINFGKRWQQFNVVENMAIFQKEYHQFKKNGAIIDYFNNFDDSISEEAMWQISEYIRPRGEKKKRGT